MKLGDNIPSVEFSSELRPLKLCFTLEDGPSDPCPAPVPANQGV